MDRIQDQIDRGHDQWCRLWKRWVTQWSQTKFLQLTDELFGTPRPIHSSQLTGWRVGNLREPGPKVLLAVGRFNQALARSNGWEPPPEVAKDVLRFSGNSRPLWQGKWHLVYQGQPLGPIEVFQALTGLIPLEEEVPWRIAPADAPAVQAAMGPVSRRLLAAVGRDWFGQLDLLTKRHRAFIPVLTGSGTVDSTELTELIPLMAAEAEVAPEELWAQVSAEMSCQVG